MPWVRYVARAVFEQSMFEKETTAVISIGDPGSTTPSKCADSLEYLRLEFLDIDYQQGDGIHHRLERFCLDSHFDFLNRKYPGFNRKMAKDVEEFVFRHTQRNILIHCDYGKSRSVSIARWAASQGHWALVGDVFPHRAGNLWCHKMMHHDSAHKPLNHTHLSF